MRRRRVSTPATLLVGLALCCCTRDGKRFLVGIAESKESRVIVDVKNSDDLGNLYVQYLTLVDAGKEALLEVNLSSGEYGKASFGPIGLNLEPAMGKTSKVDVVLRGAGGGAKVVWADLASTITARSLRLENLIITRKLTTVLKLKVQTGLVMKNVTVVDNQQGAPLPQNLIDVMGTAGAGPYTVDIQDSAFIGNTEASQSALLAIQMASGAFVEHVYFDRVAFVENAFTTDVAILGAKDIRFSHCLVYEKKIPRAAGLVPTFVHYSTPHSVKVEDSTLVVDKLENVAAEQILGGGSMPVEVRKSRIFLMQGGASTAQSPLLKLKDSPVQDLLLAGKEQAIASAVAAQKSGPGAGGWSQLLAALGVTP